MKISIISSKKIVKKAYSNNAVKAVAAAALLSDDDTDVSEVEETDIDILSIGDYGAFKVTDTNGESKIVEGRIIEITSELTSSGNTILIFRLDISTQFNSELVDLISTDIINWTKSGEDTVSIEDIMQCSYQDEKSIELDTGSTKLTVRVDDIVGIVNKRTGEEKVGRISSILADQVTLDCSSIGVSDIYIINTADFESDNIVMTIKQK